MATSKDYFEFVLEHCPEEVTFRAMMGEYILYYHEKVFGGIYDDRLLVKPVKAAVSRMPEAAYEFPYQGAKPMLLVDRPEDRVFLKELLDAMYPELPAPKKNKRKTNIIP